MLSQVETGNAKEELQIDGQFPDKLQFLFQPERYKVAWGGRGGAKSWGFARALLLLASQQKLRILCARETQNSIEESVYKLLVDQIEALGLQGKFLVRKNAITCRNGSLFVFRGIRQNVGNVKSFEGFDIVWVEEAQLVSRHSWNVLIPTIRKKGSEIWVTFNPELEEDETYQRFVANPPADAVVVNIGWEDNPWFPPVLEREMEDLARRDPAECAHVYGGTCRVTVEGAIYRAEMTLAESEGRLTRVPYDPVYPVDTYWDLGYGDNTAIWFAQSRPFEFRLIDYLSGSLQGLAYYLKEMQAKPYVYGQHVLPHDGKAHELGSGKSIEEQMRALGMKVRCAKRLSITDGLAAVRAVFPKCSFDRERCADGLSALRHYKYEFDPERLTYKREPLHDWASHGAEAFKTFALAVKEAAPEEQVPRRETPRQERSSGNWMG